MYCLDWAGKLFQWEFQDQECEIIEWEELRSIEFDHISVGKNYVLGVEKRYKTSKSVLPFKQSSR